MPCRRGAGRMTERIFAESDLQILFSHIFIRFLLPKRRSLHDNKSIERVRARERKHVWINHAPFPASVNIHPSIVLSRPWISGWSLSPSRESEQISLFPSDLKGPPICIHTGIRIREREAEVFCRNRSENEILVPWRRGALEKWIFIFHDL